MGVQAKFQKLKEKSADGSLSQGLRYIRVVSAWL